MIRQTSNGLSAGFDYNGRMLSEMDDFRDSKKILITQAPTKGILTLYSIIGDAFVVFCGVLLFISIYIIRKQKTTSNM